tara:strand:- start:2381 stop:2698 length:318 start_codon:yes stop_codon:yes gene_type:complete
MSIIETPATHEWPYIKVYGSDFRPYLKDMADTVTRLELWDWFKNESPPDDRGYMFWGHSNIDKISNGLPENPHSGATFGFCMRCMQAIAKDGFDEWCRKQNNVPN